jgi:hypothetical protein
MPIDKQYMKKVDKLLKEAGRLDLMIYAFEKNKPEDPVEFVEKVIAEHPEKRERVNPYSDYTGKTF